MEVTEKVKKPAAPKKDLKEIFRNIFSHNPHRDWAILVILFAGLVVGIIVWQLQLFAQIQRGEAFASSQRPVVQVGGINRQDLMKTVAQLNEKKQLFEFLRKTAPSAVDPSI